MPPPLQPPNMPPEEFASCEACRLYLQEAVDDLRSKHHSRNICVALAANLVAILVRDCPAVLRRQWAASFAKMILAAGEGLEEH